MKSGKLHIPRWLLGIEMLVCFVPLTLLGVAVAGAAFAGAIPPSSAVLYLSEVAVGPLGLIIALLPAIGVAHLLVIAKRAPPPRAPIG
jgi:hypothetical protein